jgi:predicted metal-dependent peptidase
MKTPTITDPEVAMMITRARTALILDEPFFGQLALNLMLVEDKTIGTLCVSRSTVRYSPDFIRTLSPSVVKSAIGHEVGHCVYDTFGRRESRDPKGWNIATDYKINQLLEEAGFELGEGWLRNKAYDDFSAEHIYSLLPTDKNGNPDNPDTGEQGGSLDDQDESPSGPEDMTPTDWKMAVVQAANAAKQVGKLPGSMDRLVEGITNPQVDWRAQFQRYFTERSKDDYSWSRPNRRMMQYGIILPSLYSESMGTAVVFIDTSGSIDQVTLDAFGAEVTAMHAASRPARLVVVYCDSDINHVDEFGPNDELFFKMHGGGGTDFRPPFIYVEENDINPVVGVYLTDLYGPQPETPPNYPFLWCCTTNHTGAFGDTIKVNV